MPTEQTKISKLEIRKALIEAEAVEAAFNQEDSLNSLQEAILTIELSEPAITQTAIAKRLGIRNTTVSLNIKHDNYKNAKRRIMVRPIKQMRCLQALGVQNILDFLTKKLTPKIDKESGEQATGPDNEPIYYETFQDKELRFKATIEILTPILKSDDMEPDKELETLEFDYGDENNELIEQNGESGESNGKTGSE